MKPSAIINTLPKLLAKRRPVFLWGAPGVGKSDVVRKLAKNMNIQLSDVRLSLLDSVDLRGLPLVDAIKEQTRWLPGSFLPTEGEGILFLDEMNAAPQSVQSAAYQLILDRKLGEYALPDGWSIIAAGNRASDRAVVHAMPSALANRFVHIDYDVSGEDWDEWARVNDVHLHIRSFRAFRPALLHDFNPSTNPRAFPSPRSWAFVNDIIGDGHAPEDEYELIKGTVGEGAAAEFCAFMRQLEDLPSIQQVQLDPEGATLPKNPSAQYAICTALQDVVTGESFPRLMKYVSRLPVEIQTLFVRAAARKDKKVTTTKVFFDWGVKNNDVLV